MTCEDRFDWFEIQWRFQRHFAVPVGGNTGEGRGGMRRRPQGRFDGGGLGGRRERLFDSGDIKLVILKLLADEPSYGYQLIKKLEERLAGGYSPSAGVIYPTLTALEEEDLVTSEIISDKKVYRLAPDGTAYLDENATRVQELFERLEETGKGFERGRHPEIMRSFRNLRSAVIARVSRGTATPEQIQTIVEAINAAAKSIDEI